MVNLITQRSEVIGQNSENRHGDTEPQCSFLCVSRSPYFSFYYLSSFFCFLLSVLCSCNKFFNPVAPEVYNLPAVHLYIDRENLEVLNSNIFSDRYVNGRLVYDEKEYKVKVRYHGYYGRKEFKKSYKIKFELTDLFENKEKIVLRSQVFDPSCLRWALATYLFKSTGNMTAEERFVSLFLNGEFKGLYSLIEPIDEFFFINRDKKVGHFYKAYSGLAQFTFVGGYDVRVGFKKHPEDDGNYSDLEELIYILDTTPPKELKSKLEKVLDVNSYLQYLAVSVLISNEDGFNKNFYLHNPAWSKLTIIPWDFDLTFYNWEYTPYGQNDLSKRILEVYYPEYKSLILWLIKNEFSESRMFSLIDSLVAYIREAYENDPFFLANDYDLDKEAQALKDFIHKRIVYINEHI